MRYLKKVEANLTVMFLLLGLIVAVYAEDYSIDVSIDATVYAEDNSVNVYSSPPLIEAASFTLEIISTEKLYPGGARGNAVVPYAFYGEALSFKISVSDNDGDQDILSANAVLSDDDVMDLSDITIELLADENTRNGDPNLMFTADWTVSNTYYGMKKILISAKDAEGLEASNNGVLVGQVFLNPKVIFEATTVNGPLSSLSFEGLPGTKNVSAKQNPITIKNLDPDGVGMKIRVSVSGTDLVNNEGTGVIPISNMKVNGLSLTNTPQLLSTIASGASVTLEFTLNYPTPLLPGKYSGSIMIIIEVV